LQEKTYTYTKAGDVATLINHMTGKEYRYAYDDFHRLISETVKNRNYGGGGFSVLSNEYDGPHVHAVSATGPIMPGAPSTYYDYDANGNLTRKYEQIVTTNTDMPKIDVMKIEYDAKNMPVLIDNLRLGQESVTEFGYDANGVRTRKTVLNADGSESTTYYISPAYEIRRDQSGDHTVKSIFAGTIKIGQIEGSGTEDGELTYLAQDHLGSTAAVVDRNGEVVEGAADVDYQPFGLPRPNSPVLPDNVTHRYTGQEWDSSTDLYNYNARLYNPLLGMFITPDSLLPDLYDPQKLNRYAYARNNPIRYVDPSGYVEKQPQKTTAQTLIIVGTLGEDNKNKEIAEEWQTELGGKEQVVIVDVSEAETWEDVDTAIDKAITESGIEGQFSNVIFIGHGDEKGILLGKVAMDEGTAELGAFTNKMKGYVSEKGKQVEGITTKDALLGIFACHTGAKTFLQSMAKQLGGERKVGGFKDYLGISEDKDEKGRRAYWTSTTRILEGDKPLPNAGFSKKPFPTFQCVEYSNLGTNEDDTKTFDWSHDIF
jgi:RHS repeat-associated protein